MRRYGPENEEGSLALLLREQMTELGGAEISDRDVLGQKSREIRGTRPWRAGDETGQDASVPRDGRQQHSLCIGLQRKPVNIGQQ